MTIQTEWQGNACPQPLLLQQFLAGSLTDNDLDAIACHLQACQSCVARLERFEATTVLGHDDAGTSPFAQEEGARNLVERLQTRRRVDVKRLARLTFGDAQSERASMGRFEIRELIGAGGTASVYRAFDPITEREVALKIPHLQIVAAERRRERFLREARAVARLHHPAIVPVFEAGDDDRQCHLVTELCSGGSLRQFLDAHNSPLPPRIAARALAQLADAVQHAHQMGVLHRDIKPGNILLSAVEMGDSVAWLPDHVKLADFGLAGFAEASGTTTSEGAVLGSIRYMSPEQVEGRSRDIDERTDVHALGAVLYELLTGRTPYDAPTTAETIHRITGKPPHRQPLLDANVPRDLAAICMRSLEKEPARRYPSAADFRDDLRRFLDGRPTIAHPLRTHERLVRWVRKNRAVASLLALTMLLLSGVAVVSLIAERQAEQHAGELSTALARAENGELEARRLAYISDMRFAFQQANQGLLLDAQTLLHRQIAADAEHDLRGLEWRVLSARIDAHMSAIGQHDGVANDVDFFPDGRTIATVGEDGAICIWDARSCTPVRQFAVQSAPIYAVAVSPDGRWIAYGSGSRRDPEFKYVTVIDSLTGETLGQLNEHDTTIQAIRFSPDGRFLASASADEKVSIWQFADGLKGRMINLPIEGDALAHEIQFLQGGGQLLTVGLSRTGFRVFDCQTGEALKTFPGQHHTVDFPSLNSNLEILAFSDGYRGDDLTFLDARNGKLMSQVELGEVITNLALHPVGDRACVGTENGKVHVFSLRTTGTTGDRKLRVNLLNALQIHYGAISRLRFLDDHSIVTVGFDGRVVRFQVDESPGEESGAPPKSQRVSQIAAAPDGHVQARAGADGRVRIVDRRTEQILAVSEPLEAPANDMHWSDDGRRLAAICETGHFRSWRWDDGRLVEEVAAVYRETPNAGQCVAFSRDSAELYVGGTNPDGIEVRGLDRHVATRFVETLYGISTLAVSPDDRSILAAHEGVFVIDRESLSVQHHLSVGGACTALTFADDGRTLIVGYRDGVVRLWDLEHARLDRVLPEYDRSDAEVEVLMLSSDGRTLVAGDVGGRIRFWNTATWDFCGSLQCFTGEDVCIQTMCLSPLGDAMEALVGKYVENRRIEMIPLTPNGSASLPVRQRGTGS